MVFEYPLFPMVAKYPKMTPIEAEYPRGYSAGIEPVLLYSDLSHRLSREGWERVPPSSIEISFQKKLPQKFIIFFLFKT